MTSTPKHTVLDAFIAHKANMDAMLKRLQAASTNHFETNPDSITWGDVGFLADISKDLELITNRVFQEGEYSFDLQKHQNHKRH